MRTPYGVSSLVTEAVAMVWSRSSLITPSLIYARPLAAAGHAMLHAELRGQSLALRSVAAGGGDHQQLHFASSQKPCRADAEHSFIVTAMKPVVHVPWYQVRPWILSAGADA
jgi:hypothetical protein